MDKITRKPTPLMIELLRMGAADPNGRMTVSDHNDRTQDGLLRRDMADTEHAGPWVSYLVITDAGRAYLAKLDGVDDGARAVAEAAAVEDGGERGHGEPVGGVVYRDRAGRVERCAYVGAVLSLGERNLYHDSYFYAVVWDEAAQRLETVEYGSTAYPSYSYAEVDATREVIAKAVEFRAGRYLVDWEEAHRARVEKGMTARVTVRGVVHTGTIGWVGEAFRSEWAARYGTHVARYGVRVPGMPKMVFRDAGSEGFEVDVPAWSDEDRAVMVERAYGRARHDFRQALRAADEREAAEPAPEPEPERAAGVVVDAREADGDGFRLYAVGQRFADDAFYRGVAEAVVDGGVTEYRVTGRRADGWEIDSHAVPVARALGRVARCAEVDGARVEHDGFGIVRLVRPDGARFLLTPVREGVRQERAAAVEDGAQHGAEVADVDPAPGDGGDDGGVWEPLSPVIPGEAVQLAYRVPGEAVAVCVEPSAWGGEERTYRVRVTADVPRIGEPGAPMYRAGEVLTVGVSFFDAAVRPSAGAADAGAGNESATGCEAASGAPGGVGGGAAPCGGDGWAFVAGRRAGESVRVLARVSRDALKRAAEGERIFRLAWEGRSEGAWMLVDADAVVTLLARGLRDGGMVHTRDGGVLRLTRGDGEVLVFTPALVERARARA